MAAPTLVDAAALATGNTDGSNQKSDNVTLTAGANFLLYGGAWVDATQQNLTGVTYNGVALTQVSSALVQVDATSVSRGWPSADLWYLKNPLTGSSAALLRTMNGGTPTRMLDGYSSWSGVDGTTPIGSAITVTGTVGATSISIAPSTGTDDMAVGLMVTSADAATQFGPTAGTETWENYEGAVFGTGANHARLAHSGGSSTTLTWTKPGGSRRSVATAVALKPTAAGGYTLAADAGSVSISGTAATLRAERRLAADAGAHTITGTAAGLAAQRLLGASAGAFTIAGTDAGLAAQRLLAASAGAFTIAGTDADLAAQRLLAASAGAVTISGADATLRKVRRLAADAGAVAVTGTDATLQATRGLDAAAGSVQIVGTDATLAVRQPGQAAGKATRYEWADLDELLARRQRLLRQDGKVRPFSERDLYGRLRAWQPEAQRAAGRPFEDASEFVQLKASGVAAATARAHEEQEAYAQWTGRRGVMRYADLAAFLDRIGDSK